MSKLKQALERAKATQSPFGPPPERNAKSAPETIPPATETRQREDVNPVYSQTKTIKIDPRVLQRNRIVSIRPAEAVSDRVKILQSQVLNEMERIHGNTLLVTSPNPWEGKSVTAINLAISISQKLDKTVLLVDAHLRHPAVHRYLGIQFEGGLSEYLLQAAELRDILINPGIEKLVILPSGRPLPNSSEILGSPRMESLVKELKSRYPDRFLIFDSSPLLTSADPITLARYTDGVLLVVESEKTAAQDLEKGLGLLKGTKVIGTVLNKTRGSRNV